MAALEDAPVPGPAMGDLEGSRVYHTAVLINDYQVLVAGGHGPSGSSLDSLELFDTNRGGYNTPGFLDQWIR